MVMFSALLIASAVIGNVNVYGLSSSKSPGDQFSLNNWKLTLPDSSASEISPDDLEDDYTSKYFYTASDGSMTFYVPGDGGLTDSAKYPRSELRQLCDPDASNPDRYNWAVDSYNYVEGTYKIGDLDSSSRKVVIQQIHAYDDPPLIKCQYESNKVYALIKTDEDGDDEDKVLLGEVDDDEKFVLKTVVTKYGNLKVYFNGNLQTSYYVGDYWGDKMNYFKAGNYLQSNDDDAFSYVHMYSLGVYTGSSNCEWSSSSFTSEDSTSTNTTTIAVAVSIVVILAIGGVIFGFWYAKKSNKDAKEEVKSMEDIIDEDSTANNNNGDSACDTPVGDVNADGGDGVGSDTPNTHSTNDAYDMDPLEIEVQVDVNNE